MPAMSAANTSTDPAVKLRLYGMMFLQYFIQGSYLPIISVYLEEALKFNFSQLGDFGAAISVGPLLAPFVIGQLVDRHFATQKVLAACHLAAGAVMLMLYTQTELWPVLVLGTIYSILYVPTMMLTNSLTFYHLANRDREFPLVRVWGTIGFILPAWLIELFWLRGLTGDELNQNRGICLILAGASGLLMGVYSLMLPNTPPPERRAGGFAPGKVLRLFTVRNFLVLVLVSFGVAFVHQFFFLMNGPYLTAMLRSGGIKEAYEQRISSIGQISEIAVMALLGLAIVRLGFKRVMLIGLTAYMLRCLLFAVAVGADWPFAAKMTLVGFGQALHGFCFGCFLATAYMYVDRHAPLDIRGSMQTIYGTFVLGIGFFLGALGGGRISDGLFTTNPGVETLRQQLGIVSTAGQLPFVNVRMNVEQIRDWSGIWLTSAAIAGICTLAFALFFPRSGTDEKTT